MWWPGTESNRRRQPFQGCALPSELPGHARIRSSQERRRSGRDRLASGIVIVTICARFPQIQLNNKNRKWRHVSAPSAVEGRYGDFDQQDCCRYAGSGREQAPRRRGRKSPSSPARQSTETPAAAVKVPRCGPASPSSHTSSTRTSTRSRDNPGLRTPPGPHLYRPPRFPCGPPGGARARH